MSPARPPRVVVTRPRAQAAAWVERLREHGIAAAALPLIEIAAVEGEEAVRLAQARQRLAGHALVVFVSANAVLHFFAGASLPWPAGVRAAAPGPGTAAALRSAGVPAELTVEPAADAAQFDSESLWAQLQGSDWSGRSVMLVRGDGGRDWLGERLVDAGARVVELGVYRRSPPAWSSAERATFASIVGEPTGWAWLFTSSAGIGHLVEGEGGARWPDHTAIATHPRIAARAAEAGFGRVVECRPGLPALVACIQSMRP